MTLQLDYPAISSINIQRHASMPQWEASFFQWSYGISEGGWHFPWIFPTFRASGFSKSYMLPSSFLPPSLPLPFPLPLPDPDLSGHCRTSTANSRSQWALPHCGRGVKRNPRTERSNTLTSRPIPCLRNWRTNQGSLSCLLLPCLLPFMTSIDFPHADRCLRDPWHCPGTALAAMSFSSGSVALKTLKYPLVN